MPSVLGWDIGGVNTKAALVVDGVARGVRSRAFEIQRSPDGLITVLTEMAAALEADARTAHAVTMTAELSQMFRTKREGVRFVVDAVEAAFPGAAIHVYATDGSFRSPREAREQPLLVAAANWVATAALVAQHHADALLVDVGTTTTDLIPIVDGQVVATGRTDLDRLTSGELVYTGAVRTPVEAIVRDLPVPGGHARVSAEGFALAGDVHLWLGNLVADDYEAATPDGRAATRVFVGERLARVVCADREMLDEQAVTRLAQAVADAQVEQIATAIRTLQSRHASFRTAVVTGLGAFIGERAAQAAGLAVVPLSSHLGAAGARSAPATAVALLWEQRGRSEDRPLRGEEAERSVAQTRDAITVIKLGGGLLADPDEWRAAVATVAGLATSHRLVVVPGGGPFANAVRDVDGRLGLGDDSSHWLAIAAMNQHADVIAGWRGDFVRVGDAAGIRAAHNSGHVPVLAPLQWLRSVDPLPHSWDVTSDSIAAWLAGVLKAARLVLIKPAGATGPDLVDPFFSSALPPQLPWAACHVSDLEALLRERAPSRR